MTWPDLYLRHFTRYFQKPFDVQVYHQETGGALRVATFDRAYPRYVVYASLGLSDHADDLKDLGEVILLSDDRGKDVPLIFVHSLFFILEKKIPLASRFAVGGIDLIRPDFAEHFDKVALFFTLADGFKPGFEKLEQRGDIGLVFQAIFISWAELDFLNRNGPDAFEEKFHAQDADPCSLRRPSCV
jgi:hypothetical protein